METNKIDKNLFISAIYREYDAWSAHRTYACQKGCSACCTSSVTITSLEGHIIFDYLVSNNQLSLLNTITKCDPPSIMPQYTTNTFARYCFEEIETAENDSWDMSPCLFLTNSICSIYPVRPFGCRSFSSTTPCKNDNAAVVDSATITINSMVMQIIEHIDQGNPWGQMVSVLKHIVNKKGESKTQDDEKLHLLTSQANPGFLVPPEDSYVAEQFMQTFFAAKIGGTTFSQILKAM